MTAPSSGTITLGYDLRHAGKNIFVDLTWNPVTTKHVDVNKGGTTIARVRNTGSYSDKLKKLLSYTYQVCEVGGTVCSNEVKSSF